MDRQLRIGVAGSVTRGRSFRLAVENIRGLKIQAVCDINEEKLEESRLFFGAEEKYADYDAMLKKSEIDAVIISTPMPFHAPQATAALKKNLHVISEVPAAVSVEECKKLVRAAKNSKSIYMMAENYTYMKNNVLIRAMVKKGLFGEPYYAEGEYIHELKGLNEITKWRRKWQTGINGITYGTHSLGPILQWMEGDRVERVCCAGSGHHHKDPRGDYYENEDSCVMLCKTEKGRLIKIRVDMLSDRPHSMTNYSLQGTDGCYESARSSEEKGKIWLRSLSKEKDKWMYTSELEEEYLPEEWKRHLEKAQKAGHGGGDYFEILDFVEAIRGTKPCPVGIHEAINITLPGLVSQKSIEQGGKWLPVPDSRKW